MSKILDSLLGVFSTDLAIDLGTANTCVYVKGHGLVLREPSVVAVKRDNRGNKVVLAVGHDAKRMLGRVPGNIEAIRPMKDGVIADFDVTQAMLRYFINKAYVRSLFGPKPRIVICVPSGVTEVEKRAVLEAAIAAEKKKILEASGTVLTYDGGTFKFPLATYTRISDDYGNRIHPTLGIEQFHNGVDFAAPKGTAIYAAYDGQVVAATYSNTMGNYVMIDHGGGLYTIYMHASALYVSKDDIVVRGETIAAVGSTGRSTGNHLHFSVRKDGAYTSPWNYLSQ